MSMQKSSKYYKFLTENKKFSDLLIKVDGFDTATRYQLLEVAVEIYHEGFDKAKEIYK